MKKKWFDLIASKKKKDEYREFKTYWKKRLMETWNHDLRCKTFKKFDEIHFRNGYNKKSPFMRVELIKIYIANVNFEGKIKKRFVLKLGKILEVKK